MRDNLFTVNEQISKISIQKNISNKRRKSQVTLPMPGVPGHI